MSSGTGRAPVRARSRYREPMGTDWPADAAALDAEQRRLATLRPEPWILPDGELRVAGCFLAFARGEQGPGHAGDRGWSAAAVLECATGRTLASACVPAVAGAPYEAGRLALREGPGLADAVGRLEMRPDVLVVDATGRDHPRRGARPAPRGGHRASHDRGDPPAAAGSGRRPGTGARSQLAAGAGRGGGRGMAAPGPGRPSGGRPRRVADQPRHGPASRPGVPQPGTHPEPLRRARVLARTTRAHAEGRTTQPWRDPLV